MSLLRRELHDVGPQEALQRLDARFEKWLRTVPFLGALEPGLPWLETHWPWFADNVIAVDEYRENGVLVIRAELPGIDPEKDVKITVADELLRITAKRHEEFDKEDKDYIRHEVRGGSFIRVLPLPEGVDESAVDANYKDGFLTVRVTLPESAKAKFAKEIPVAKS